MVVASHKEDAGLEVVALEESASTLGPGAYYKLYLVFYDPAYTVITKPGTYLK